MEKKVFSNHPYSMLFDPIQRKLLLDLSVEKIDIDEFRRISRGLDAISNYLDFKDKK